MRITLPYPPSANRYWRTFRGRTVVSTEAREYKKQVGLICNVGGVEPVAGEVIFRADVYRPLKRGDLSNRIKVLEDALNEYAYEDDAQIVELHYRLFDDKKNPRVEVEIEER